MPAVSGGRRGEREEREVAAPGVAPDEVAGRQDRSRRDPIVVGLHGHPDPAPGAPTVARAVGRFQQVDPDRAERARLLSLEAIRRRVAATGHPCSDSPRYRS